MGLRSDCSTAASSTSSSLCSTSTDCGSRSVLTSMDTFPMSCSPGSPVCSDKYSISVSNEKILASALPERRKKRFAAVVGLASGAALMVSASSSMLFGLGFGGWGAAGTAVNLRLNGRGRQISIALPDGNCLVTPAAVPRPPVTPVYAASYPGSGAKMTWNLIEALTGLVTGDEYGFSRDGTNVVSLKTHYPHGDGIPPKDDGGRMKRGFILIRNPRYAIPSLHNFVYEVQNNLPAHSTRAPLEEWRKWRDGNVPAQIHSWANSVEYWMERLTPDNRILVTYESLVDDKSGPDTAQRLADFLARDPNVHPIDRGNIECVWRAVVKYHEAPHLPSLAAHGIGHETMTAEEGRKLRKTLVEEIQAMKWGRDQAQVREQGVWKASKQVATQLVEAAKKPVTPNGGETTAAVTTESQPADQGLQAQATVTAYSPPVTHLQSGRRLQEAAAPAHPAAAAAAAQQANVRAVSAAADAYSTVRRADTTRGGHKAVGSMAEDQGMTVPRTEGTYLKVETSAAAPLAKKSDRDQELADGLAVPEEPKQVAAAGAVAAARPLQAEAQAAAAPQAVVQQEVPDAERELSHQNHHHHPSAQQAIEFARHEERRAKEAMIALQKGEAASGKPLGGGDPEDSKHRADNHPALPSSFRDGPLTKPYTQVQIRLMVEVMEMLQHKYADDEQLVRVLTSYIEDVKSMPGE